jgi:cell division protein FtsQ
MRKYNWKKILINTFWVLAGIGAIVLLGAAMQKKNQKQCTDIKIEITGIERHMFIDEKDVLDMLNASVQVIGTKIVSLNLRNMESLVEKNPWVSNAEMFLDNNQVLQVRIEERQPVARVFTLAGSSFYIDSTAMRLPLSDKLSARVPTFTGFPSDRESLSKPDSVLLHNVVQIGRFVLTDSFWMAQVAQIEITPQSNLKWFR